MFGNVQMVNVMKNLNDLAVEYFELGLNELSYQIWDSLLQAVQNNSKEKKELLPVISCNMGNALRKNGEYEEAGRICWVGLKSCLETGAVYAMPELILQLSALCMERGEREKAKWLYLFGSWSFSRSRQENIDKTMEELMRQDFLLYSK